MQLRAFFYRFLCCFLFCVVIPLSGRGLFNMIRRFSFSDNVRVHGYSQRQTCGSEARVVSR